MKVSPKKCELCGRGVADKKNSHIIPSFIMCNFSSSDGTGKRNHELTYSIGNTVKVYAGNEVPMDVMNATFDNLSDERLENELKKNDVTLDDVFCSSCEKALGKYLESPYSQYYKKHGNCPSEVQYFFWISVLWRVSHFRMLKDSLPKFINTELRKSLNGYLTARINDEKYDNSRDKYQICYRLLRSKAYDKNSGGSAYVEYDKVNRIYSMSLGDMMVCFTFNDDNLPISYDFLGVGDAFRAAEVNNGTEPEVCYWVDGNVFDKAYRQLIESAKSEFIDNEATKIRKLWRTCIKRGYLVAEAEPPEEFIHQCLVHIHDDKKKQGERHTLANFARSFMDALEDIGIPVRRP